MPSRRTQRPFPSEDLSIRDALPFPYVIVMLDPVRIVGPYIGFQWADVVSQRVWIHASAFQRVRWHRNQTVISYTTANGVAEFATTVAPNEVEVAVAQVVARLERERDRLPLAEAPEAQAWLQNATQPARIAGVRFSESGSDLAMVAELYRLGAQTVRIRRIIDQDGELYADEVSVTLPEDGVAARPLMEFLAQESQHGYGCKMEPDDEPNTFILCWN